MGISRIDQAEKHNHGYYVRVTRNHKTASKFFADKLYGGKRAGLRLARQYEAELLEQAKSQKQPPRKKSSRNTSGKVGVSRTTYKRGDDANQYWQAAWIDGKGVRKSVKFSVNKYGEEKARRLAIKARREGLLAREAATK